MIKAPDLFAHYINDFDKAQYHAKGSLFPKGAPYSQAYVLIGFFQGFLAENDLLNNDQMAKKRTKQFLAREIRAGELCKSLGGALRSLDLKLEGKIFTYYYYTGAIDDKDVVGVSDILYLEEYESILSQEIATAGNVYLIEDSWENYEKVKQRIQQRYDMWLKNGKPKPHYREFKSLDESEIKKVETYLRNRLSSGLFSKTFPEILVNETSFRSYLVKIKGHEINQKFYSSEKAIREYLAKFTDKTILFQIE